MLMVEVQTYPEVVLTCKALGRLQAVEGMLNSSDSSKQRVARQARKGRVVSAMQRCAVQLFNAVVGDPRVSVFFKNSDPACKDLCAQWAG